MFTVEATGADGKLERTREFECDTLFNFTMPDIAPLATANDELTRTAAGILAATGVDRGICLLPDGGDGTLAHELARQSQLRVIGLVADRKNVRSSRSLLTAAGSYGSRITVHHFDPKNPLPLTGMFANLIYLEPKPGQSRLAKRIREAANWLRPDGGIAFAPFPDETANRQSWLGALREAATGSGLTVETGSTGVKLIRGPLAGSGECRTNMATHRTPHSAVKNCRAYRTPTTWKCNGSAARARAPSPTATAANRPRSPRADGCSCRD